MTSLTASGSTTRRILRYALPALTITLGLQLLSAYVVGVAWYLRDVKSVATFGLLPYAFTPFLLALGAGILRRTIGARLALWSTSVGIAVLRFIEQVSRNSELDLWLSIAGLTLFLMFIPLFIGHCRSLGSHQAYRWVFGIIFGFALELSLRTLFGFRPLNSVNGLLPVFLVALLGISVLILNWRETFDSDRSNSEVNLGSGFSLVMLGPWMLLQMLLLGSHGFIGEVANISPSLSFTVVILGYAAALIGAYVGFKSPHGLPPLLALLFSGVLGITNYFAVGSGPYYIPVLLFSQGYLGFGLALVGVANSKGARIGLARTTVISGLGMILLLILLFGFYMAQDIALPFQRSLFPAVAGFLVGLAILQATIHVRSHAATATRYPDALIAALALLVVPLGHWVLADQPPMLKAASGEDVRVMTYNIHSGINPYGQPDLEAIARVIEASGADIIGLQEVSRMRLQDASMDMPYWLAKRLGMAYIFRGTEEPIWGNAILSRYPIIEWGWADLPRAGKLIGRGYLWSRIDTGGPEPILVIATHLHHLEPDSQARQQQVPELVQFGAGQSHVIVLGDMNAEPGSAEMNMFSEAGLIDAWALAGQGSGYTFSSLDPEKRIDWLWFSDDLIPREIEVIQTHASDHLPVDALFTFK